MLLSQDGKLISQNGKVFDASQQSAMCDCCETPEPGCPCELLTISGPFGAILMTHPEGLEGCDLYAAQGEPYAALHVDEYGVFDSSWILGNWQYYWDGYICGLTMVETWAYRINLNTWDGEDYSGQITLIASGSCGYPC